MQGFIVFKSGLKYEHLNRQERHLRPWPTQQHEEKTHITPDLQSQHSSCKIAHCCENFESTQFRMYMYNCDTIARTVLSK